MAVEERSRPLNLEVEDAHAHVIVPDSGPWLAGRDPRRRRKGHTVTLNTDDGAAVGQLRPLSLSHLPSPRRA